MSRSRLSMGAVMKALWRITAVKSSDVMVQAVYGCYDEGGMMHHGGKDLQCHGPDCLRVL